MCISFVLFVLFRVSLLLGMGEWKSVFLCCAVAAAGLLLSDGEKKFIKGIFGAIDGERWMGME